MLTFSGGRPEACAAAACAMVCICVEAQTSQRIRAHVGRAVHRLHRRVRQERHFVNRFHLLRGARQTRRGVAGLTHLDARFLRALGKKLADRGARLVGVGAFVPLDIEKPRALYGGPRVVGDNRHAARNLHYLLHARKRLRFGGVEADRLAAEHRATRDSGVDHARPARIDAELRAASDLIRRVEPLHGFADKPELLRILQRHIGGHRELRRRACQFSVAQLARSSRY